MSAQIAATQDLSNEQKLAVSFRLLLGLYAIIPVCLLLQSFDGWYWQGFLKNNLPSSPTHFILFQILFGTPHIVASAIVLVSKATLASVGQQLEIKTLFKENRKILAMWTYTDDRTELHAIGMESLKPVPWKWDGIEDFIEGLDA